LPRGYFPRYIHISLTQENAMNRHHVRAQWPFREASSSQGTNASETGALGKVVEKNIQLIAQHREESEKQKSFQDHLADLITRWSGSMFFIYAHCIWFAVWIAANVGWLGMTPFDPFPFGLLTTIVSLEAIFLSTFVLVSQNRQAALADRRSELDLQINLLAEYEMTRVLTFVDRIAKRLGIDDCDDGDLAELKKDVKPDQLLNELEGREENSLAN
jgi:uncharacterized membrane protein